MKGTAAVAKRSRYLISQEVIKKFPTYVREHTPVMITKTNTLQYSYACKFPGGGHADILIYTCMTSEKGVFFAVECITYFYVLGSKNVDFQKKKDLLFFLMWQVKGDQI